MTKLNQIVAVEKGIKSRTAEAITKVYQKFQKAPLLAGISRTYQPKDDEGDRLPSEEVRVQLSADQSLREASAALSRLFDVVATKDAANGQAVGHLVVDGNILVADVPVTTLLFLEKQLIDIRTLVKSLPVLDAAETWEFDSNTGVYVTPPVGTTRTKKIPRNHVKAEATEKHPAQVEVYYEDVLVGTWTARKFSGALPAVRVNQLLARVDTLHSAVKFAREEANNYEVTDVKIGAAIFDYLLAE